ncbi:MAG: tyrosine-type recombinase/integrase [Cyanobacteria bacterium J06648_11]
MSIPLATVATQFLDRPNLASSTVRSYESTLMPLLQQYGRWPVALLDRAVLEEYLNGLQQLSYTTHHRHQAILQALFNFAVERGYLKANPIAGLRRRKPIAAKGEHGTDNPIRYLTPDQLQALYRAVTPDCRMHALTRLLHRSGARIAELLSTNLSDLDRERRRFPVIGKGNKRRWCFYSEDAAEILAQYLKFYRHPESEALFTAQHRVSGKVTRLSYSTARHHWRSLTASEPLLKGIRMHDLRHTFATERVGLMGIEQLRALMGHQNIQTTLRYQKVTSEQAESIAQQAFSSLL